MPPDSTQAPATAENSAAQRQKVLSFIKGLLSIEQDVERRFSALTEKYAGIDSHTVYTSRDLASADGIRGARSRLQKYRSMVDGLDVILRDKWNDHESLVRSADLDEPLKSQVRSSFARTQPSIRAAFDGWMAACRTSARAMAEVLDFAERNSHLIKFEREQLVFATESASNEYAALRQNVEVAESRNDNAQRAAQSVDDGILPLLRKALSQ